MAISVQYHNDVKMLVTASDGIDHDLSEYFSFFAEGYRYMAKYRNKLWDGKIRLVTPYNPQMYIGLLATLIDYAKFMDIPIDIEPRVYKCFYSGIDSEQIEDFINQLDVRSSGNEIQPYEHQIKAVKAGLQLNRMTLLSPTSSGKSLIIYYLIRYYLEQANASVDHNILVVVPSVMLTDQLLSDFVDYSSHDTFSATDTCHQIIAGKSKETDKRVTITTWQSVFKQPRSWFDKYSCCIVDEVHQAKAKSITGIMEKLPNCPIKHGLTGTLDGTECNKLVISGLFGPVQEFVTTTDLMDKGLVAQLKIENLILKYPAEECKENNKATYQNEIKYIVNHAKRNNMVADLAAVQKDTCLILANNVAHCKNLYDLCKKKTTGREVYLITGKTKSDLRSEIRKSAELDKGAIIVATYGCLSTGVSIKNIHSVIFASPTKSMIRTLQSIGRGLRISSSKWKVKLYDIVDDLSHRKHKNYALKHFIERLKIYNKQKFDYSINKLEL